MSTLFKKIVCIITLFLLPCLVMADSILRSDHPLRYVVQPGDTLWGIASRFLQRPWQWQRLWQGNPQITYPHDLYVGDVLELHWLNGQPHLILTQGGRVKLSPRMRGALHQAIPTVPIEAVQNFLDYTQVFNEKVLTSAPYIVAMVGEHVTGGGGDEIYVRSIFSAKHEVFGIFRAGAPFIDPTTKRKLGYQGVYIGKAALIKPGDPATMQVIQATQELLTGDRLVAKSHAIFNKNFMPHAPNRPVFAQIIAVLGDSLTQIGRFNSVVINRGRNQGMQVGEVLSAYHMGGTIIDPIQTEHRQRVTLPDQVAGQLMIYRVFDEVSFGLVMEATQPMHLLDKVTNPDDGQHNFERHVVHG